MSEPKCAWPISCDRKVEANGYCFQHNKLCGGAKTTGPKPKKELPKESRKRNVEKKQYKKIVDEKIKKDPRCKIKSPVCTSKAQGGDHKQKRSPKNYADPENIVPACNACNLYKEEHPEWAKANGHSISRFKKQR